MYKEEFSLNNPQWLICHKTKPNQTKTVHVINVVFIRFGIKSFYCAWNGRRRTNQDSNVAVIKMLNLLGISHFVVPQAPFDELSLANQVLSKGGLPRPGDQLNNTHLVQTSSGPQKIRMGKIFIRFHTETDLKCESFYNVCVWWWGRICTNQDVCWSQKC